jgi:hypothetical protein
MAKSPKLTVKGRKDVAAAITDKTPVAAPAHTFDTDKAIIVNEAASFAKVTRKDDIAAALKRRVGDLDKFALIKDAWYAARVAANMADQGVTIDANHARAVAGVYPKDSGKNLLFHGAKGDAPQRTAGEQKAYRDTVAAWHYFTRIYDIHDALRAERAPRAPGEGKGDGKSETPAPSASASAKVDATAPIAPEAINVVTSDTFVAAMAQLKTWEALGQRVGNASAKVLNGDKGERVRKLLAYVHAEMAALELMN